MSRVRQGSDLLEGGLFTLKVGWEQAMTESTRWGKVRANRVRQGVCWAPGSAPAGHGLVPVPLGLSLLACEAKAGDEKTTQVKSWGERGSRRGFWALKLSL